MRSFNDNCAAGMEPVPEKIAHHLNNSLMLATALNQHIGYERAAQIAKTAHRENTTLREVALRLGLLTADEFDRYVDPRKMVHPEK